MACMQVLGPALACFDFRTWYLQHIAIEIGSLAYEINACRRAVVQCMQYIAVDGWPCGDERTQ